MTYVNLRLSNCTHISSREHMLTQAHIVIFNTKHNIQSKKILILYCFLFQEKPGVVGVYQLDFHSPYCCPIGTPTNSKYELCGPSGCCVATENTQCSLGYGFYTNQVVCPFWWSNGKINICCVLIHTCTHVCKRIHEHTHRHKYTQTSLVARWGS